MENNKQKVYINPNFNRTGTHVNKYFSHAPNIPVQNNKRKIFVNPNFLPSIDFMNISYQSDPGVIQVQNNVPQYNIYCSSQSFYPLPDSSTLNNYQSFSTPATVIPFQEQNTTYNYNGQNNYQTVHIQKSFIEPMIQKSKFSFVRNTNLIQIPVKQAETPIVIQETKKESSTNSNIPLTNNTVAEKKSRYCLIRNNTNVTKNNTNNTVNSKASNSTIKISKYKTITVNNLKKELQTVNDMRNKYSYQLIKPRILLPRNKSLNLSLLRVSPRHNKYKYKNLENIRKKLDIKNTKLTSSTNRSILLSKNRTLIRKYKINNIPSPLYVKYGKCLRKSNGRCEYLHDKKHVSLCRKFIKGLCHDTNCLLSHELSAKKMPTCYFYLKGMCTKENCPYLHVKLSSKSKICRDFLKGYCEKGENCKERHVLPTPKVRRIPQVKQFKLPLKNVQKFKKSQRVAKIRTKVENSNLEDQSDQRYFKDTVNDNETCETIKPIRCKLGSLPSYIKLG